MGSADDREGLSYVVHDLVEAVGRAEDADLDGAVAAEAEGPPAAAQIVGPARFAGEVVKMFCALDGRWMVQSVHDLAVETQALPVAVIADASEVWETLAEGGVDAHGVVDVEALDVYVDPRDPTGGAQAVFVEALRDVCVALVGVAREGHVGGSDFESAHLAAHEAGHGATFSRTDLEVFAQTVEGVVGGCTVLDLASREFVRPAIPVVGVGAHAQEEFLGVGVGGPVQTEEELPFHTDAAFAGCAGEMEVAQEPVKAWISLRFHFQLSL